MPKSEVNKKLLNSLHEKWDMNVFVIKKASDLNKMTLAKTLAVIKSFDMDVKQREINRAGYNVGTSSNSAFSAQPTITAPSSSCAPVVQPQVYSAGTSSNVPTIHTGPMAKGVEENLAMMTGLISCYNALVTGELAPPVLMSELIRFTLMTWKKWTSLGISEWLCFVPRNSHSVLGRMLGE